MRREFQISNLSRVLFDDMPYHFLRHFIAPDFTRSTNAPKQPSMGNIGSQQPIVNDSLNPSWHRYRSHVTAFADEINNCPMIFAPLKMVHGQFGQLPASESAPQKQAKNSPIPLSLYGGRVRELPQHSSFLRSQPVPQSATEFFCAFDTPNPGR
jgi:hypothetical protein